MSEIDAWNSRVRAHHTQSIEAQGGPGPADFWKGSAKQFQDDPIRTDDPVVYRLFKELNPETTVLEVVTVVALLVVSCDL